MKIRIRTAGRFYSLIIISFFALVAWQGRASVVEVDWTSAGFSSGLISINVGDEVDIVNFDDTFDLNLTSGPSPENFFTTIPAYDGVTLYYVPVVYNHAGTFTLSDEFGGSATVQVNLSVPLSVTITDPTNNAVFTAPATFNVTAVPAGGAAPYDVQFFVETNLVGEVFSDPFTNAVTNLLVGSYNINVVVTDDNFNMASNSIQVSVTAPLPPPPLTATRVGNQIIISWPTNNSDGLSLQTATSLGASASWGLASPLPAPLGSLWAVTNSISGPAQFFRLSNH